MAKIELKAKVIECFKNLWKGTSNIVGWSGLVIACVSIYMQTIGKEHELNISISSLEVQEENLTIGILYNNNGDYVETVTFGGLSLPWSDTGAQAYYLEDCFKPVLIKSKDAEHRYYTIHIPLEDPDKSDQKVSKHKLDMSYKIVMPDGTVSSQSKTVGSITHRMLDGLIERAEISSNLLSVDFDDSGTNHLGSHFIPSSYKATDFTGCHKPS